MPTGGCSTPSSKLANGRTSIRSLSKLKRSNSRSFSDHPVSSVFRRGGALLSFRIKKGHCAAGTPPSIGARLESLPGAMTALKSLQSFNLQRPTLNVQRPIKQLRVGRWTSEVRRWTFCDVFRRVKGAWWPSRSSKPPSAGNGRDRFDSYPLRHTKFGCSRPLGHPTSPQTSIITFKHPERR